MSIVLQDIRTIQVNCGKLQNALGTSMPIYRAQNPSIFHLPGALHEWYRPNATDVGTTITSVDTGSIAGLNLANPDVTAEPAFNSNTLGFNGTTQYLYKSTSNFRGSDNAGVIHVKFKATDNTLNQNNYLFGVGKQTVADLLNVSYKNLMLRFAIQDFGVFTTVLESTTTISLNSINTLTAYSNGSITKIALNGVVLAVTTTGTNSGRWFNDISGGTDNITIGAVRVASVGYGKSDIYGVWYEPFTTEASVLANGLDIQNNAV